MLTGEKIVEEYEAGKLYISEFDTANVQPNSYELHWGDTYKEVLPNRAWCENGEIVQAVDMRRSQRTTQTMQIPEDGLLLMPGRIYLIPTKEVIGSNYYVPQIVGRSSVGRMGISISLHAALGDLGYLGNWTLQVTVVRPTIIYPDLRVCHVYFEEVHGKIEELYHGRYQNSFGAVESRFIENKEK